MDTSYAPDAARDTHHQLATASFLQVLEDRLGSILDTLNVTQARLTEAGFYGPPAAVSGVAKPESENNLRSRISTVVDRLEDRSKEIQQQLERAC